MKATNNIINRIPLDCLRIGAITYVARIVVPIKQYAKNITVARASDKYFEILFTYFTLFTFL